MNGFDAGILRILDGNIVVTMKYKCDDFTASKYNYCFVLNAAGRGVLCVMECIITLNLRRY